MRCVKPSRATLFPSKTWLATASRNGTIEAKASPSTGSATRTKRDERASESKQGERGSQDRLSKLRAYIAYFVYPSARSATVLTEFSMPRAESRPAAKIPTQPAITPTPAPVPPPILTPAAQVDALTGDPNFMTSLALGLV